MKQRFIKKHEELLNDRYKAVTKDNQFQSQDDLQNLTHATYYMGTDTGYDDCLDDVETTAKNIVAFGVGIFGIGMLLKALYNKFMD